MLLKILVLNRGRVMSQQRLQDQLCGHHQAVTPNAIEAHISTPRKKLRMSGAADLIKTRRGFSYYIDVD